LRAVTDKLPTESPKVKSLYQAAPGVVRTFGFLPGALADADGDVLRVVEGAVNYVWNRLAHEAAVVGLHGAGSAGRLLEALSDELRLTRDQGASGPRRIVLDIDHDTAGDKAVRQLVKLGKRFGVTVVRIEKREGQS
jgi:hypothetical protein